MYLYILHTTRVSSSFESFVVIGLKCASETPFVYLMRSFLDISGCRTQWGVSKDTSYIDVQCALKTMPIKEEVTDQPLQGGLSTCSFTKLYKKRLMFSWSTICKLIKILHKTWKKLSPRVQSPGLKELFTVHSAWHDYQLFSLPYLGTYSVYYSFIYYDRLS